MHVGHAAAGHFERADEERRLHQRQQPFEERQGLGRGLARLHAVESVVRQLAARLHQVLRLVDHQVRQHALAFEQQQERIGDAGRQVEHGEAQARCGSR